MPLQARLAHQLVDREAHRHRACVTHRLPGVLDHLAQQPHAVLERPPVLIGAAVGTPGDELEGPEAHARVDVDDVEAGALRPLRGVHLPGAQVADVVLVHRARVQRVRSASSDLKPGQPRGRERHLARGPVAGEAGPVEELHSGERAVLVHRVHHQREVPRVLVVPQPRVAKRGVVRRRVDRAVAGAHHPPAPSARIARRPLRVFGMSTPVLLAWGTW